MDIQKLITDLRAYNGHITVAVQHLELAAAVGVKRGRGRPRKEAVQVGTSHLEPQRSSKHHPPSTFVPLATTK
jgi:hypothetical protein